MIYLVIWYSFFFDESSACKLVKVLAGICREVHGLEEPVGPGYAGGSVAHLAAASVLGDRDGVTVTMIFVIMMIITAK